MFNQIFLLWRFEKSIIKNSLVLYIFIIPLEVYNESNKKYFPIYIRKTNYHLSFFFFEWKENDSLKSFPDNNPVCTTNYTFWKSLQTSSGKQKQPIWRNNWHYPSIILVTLKFASFTTVPRLLRYWSYASEGWRRLGGMQKEIGKEGFGEGFPIDILGS